MPDYTASNQIFEFRGVDKFYFAEVTQDDSTAYTCGTPVHIPVQEVGKSTDSSSEAHYYDNKAMIVVNSESADTITLTLAPPDLQKLATMIGKSFDSATGMMVDSPKQNKYFAITYRSKGTDGGYRYVSRLKGQFNIPDETFTTEDDGTDTSNTQIEFTGIYTEHEFAKGIYNGTSWESSGAKGIVVDDRYGLADVSNFFSAIQTPDTISVQSGTLTTDNITVAQGGTGALAVKVNGTTVSTDLTFTLKTQPVDAGSGDVTVDSSGSVTVSASAAVGDYTVKIEYTGGDSTLTTTATVTVTTA